MSPMSPRLLRPSASGEVPIWVAALYGHDAVHTGPTWRANGLVFASLDGQNFWNIGDPSGVLIPPEGINDPTILQWRGAYYMCYGGGGGTNGLVGTRWLAIDKSTDLLNWTRVTSWYVDATSGGLAVPAWVVDDAGPAIIGVLDPPHSIFAVRPPSPSPATWSGSWSFSLLTDYANEVLTQGNTYVVYKDGTYYMAYNEAGWNGYKKRTSANLTSGWSAPAALGISSEANGGDSQPLVLLPDGRFRFYASNGNSLLGLMWYWESSDLANWGPAVPLTYVGEASQFSPVNWSHPSRITVSPSLYATVLSYRPPPSAPSAPQALTATPGNGQVGLSWLRPSSSGSSAIADYAVQYSSDSGATWTTFTDSVSLSQTETVTGLTNGTSYVFRVSAVNAVGAGPYSTASGPVTPAVPPPAVSRLLLHFDTDTSDSSGGSASVTNSGVTISTSIKKYGAGSAYFDGGSWLDVSNTASVSGAGDFTVEFWVWIESAQDAQVIAPDGSGLTVALGYGGQRVWAGSPSFVTPAEDPLSIEEWHHIAVVRASGVATIYVDGVAKTSSAMSTNFASNPMLIGANGREALIGYLDDLRIVQGLAVYAGSSFTPPTGPLSSSVP